MHPTNRESMLLTVQQEDPDSSNNDSVKPDNVSEDELDMILATMGTTSLKDSEMAILQNDAPTDEQDEDEAEVPEVEEVSAHVQPLPTEAQPLPEIQAPIEAQPSPSIDPPPSELQAPSEEPKVSARNSARRVVKNFFNRLRKVK